MKNEDLIKKIECLIKDGFSINTGDVLEVVLYGIITNSLLCGAVLQKQFELEQLTKGEVLDEEKAEEETKEIFHLVQEKAQALKDNMIAELHLRNETK